MGYKLTDIVCTGSHLTLYFFTSSISHGVENYVPKLWGTGISDASFIVIQHLLHISVVFGSL